MAERNRITVRILGTEYGLSGDGSREQMLRVADYVDTRLRELMTALPNRGKADIAVLAAMNAAEEYFGLLDGTENIRRENEQLRKDVDHYNALWEDAKRNFIAYKEENQQASSERMAFQQELVEKNGTVQDLRSQVASLRDKLRKAEEQNQNLVRRLSEQKENQNSSSLAFRELEQKCRELENSYFDLQMENIRLKGEMERLRSRDTV